MIEWGLSYGISFKNTHTHTHMYLYIYIYIRVYIYISIQRVDGTIMGSSCTNRNHLGDIMSIGNYSTGTYDQVGAFITIYFGGWLLPC